MTGYTTQADRDGADGTWVNLGLGDHPGASCSADSSCAGFNLAAKLDYTLGYWKTVVSPSIYSYGMCLYTRSECQLPHPLAHFAYMLA